MKEKERDRQGQTERRIQTDWQTDRQTERGGGKKRGIDRHRRTGRKTE